MLMNAKNKEPQTQINMNEGSGRPFNTLQFLRIQPDFGFVVNFVISKFHTVHDRTSLTDLI